MKSKPLFWVPRYKLSRLISNFPLPICKQKECVQKFIKLIKLLSSLPNKSESSFPCQNVNRVKHPLSSKKGPYRKLKKLSDKYTHNPQIFPTQRPTSAHFEVRLSYMSLEAMRQEPSDCDELS